MIPQTARKPQVEVTQRGHDLLDNPMLNKGSAFTEDERREFGLLGLLPPHVASIEEQVARTYENYRRKESPIERYIFLTGLQDRNEVLFYRLVLDHLEEMAPIIYTPTVGVACQDYSHIYRRPRGLYISYTYMNDIETILQNAPARDIAIIVATDGGRILGLGDLGVGGMAIPVGKLSLYTLCAGIHPQTTLPVVLDAGTDNRELLNDPLYLGWHHPRIHGSEYDAFVEAFVQAVQKIFPHAILQWEDFSKENARRLLERYRHRLCSFNDDIQGTGAVTLAGLLTAMRATGGKLFEQRILILGAGSAATGICDQLVAAMMREGCSEREARLALWLVDIHGLVHTGCTNLDAIQQRYAQPVERVTSWELTNPNFIGFADVVKNLHPTVLIGTTATPGIFSEEIIREMAAHVPYPVIFPLSNPTSKSEATPEDLITWTDGRAFVATGSPFPPVIYGGQVYRTGQCNNALIFPGVGLGLLAARARSVTDGMFVAAAQALSELAPAHPLPTESLFPPMNEVRCVARHVAQAVGREAQNAGLAEIASPAELERRLDALMWEPRYEPLRRKSCS